MPKSLAEYIDWLDERELTWPLPPRLQVPKATPYVKRFPGIRVVTWSVYGTLLRIADGRLLFDPPQQLRMQVAMDKTIQEFNMWQSMARKPGPPWEQMYAQYKRLLEELEMAPAGKGETPEVDAARIWQTLIERLTKKEYQWDESLYGDLGDYSRKVAYFFHASLQGVEAAAEAARTVAAIAGSRVKQTLLADGQHFTPIQLLRALKKQDESVASLEPFDLRSAVLSIREGVRKPSASLYRALVDRFAAEGIEPHEILHVGSRLKDDLVVARQHGLRTALYAGDELSLQADKSALRDKQLKPDRLLTELAQLCDVLAA